MDRQAILLLRLEDVFNEEVLIMPVLLAYGKVRSQQRGFLWKDDPRDVLRSCFAVVVQVWMDR